MIVFAVLVGLILLSTVSLLKWSRYSDGFEFAGVMGLIVSGTFLVGALICLPCDRLGTYGKIKEFESVRSTIQEARAKQGSIEIAALTLEIAKCNQWLANTQYWNSTIFDWWYPDEVEALEPLK